MPVDISTLEDRLAADAIALVEDIRGDRAAAHRALRAMGRLELEQLACVLAAMVDPGVKFNIIAWWRVDANHTTEQIEEAA